MGTKGALGWHPGKVVREGRAGAMSSFTEAALPLWTLGPPRSMSALGISPLPSQVSWFGCRSVGT